jgi:subtilase family serine protease
LRRRVRRIVDRRFNRARYDADRIDWPIRFLAARRPPLFAGIVALADQVAHHPLGLINPALDALSARQAPGLVDVTTGNNTVAFTQNGTLFTVRGFHGRPGYDLASGVGTINAARFVPELARAAGRG